MFVKCLYEGNVEEMNGNSEMDHEMRNASSSRLLIVTTNDFEADAAGISSLKHAIDMAIFIMTVPTPPVLCIVGLLGNFLSFILMRQQKYEKSTACFYMRCLAVFDCFYIYGRMVLRYLLSMAPHLFVSMHVKQPFCLYYFVSFRMGVFLSPWMLVAMALDRFLAVNWPLKAVRFLTMGRAKITVVIVSGCGAGFGLAQLTRTWQEKYSHWLCPYEYDPPMDLIYSYIGGVVETFLPIFFISFFNIGILLALHRSSQNKMLQKPERSSRESSINLATFLVTSSFIVFRIPAKVNDFFWEYWQGEVTPDIVQWKRFSLNVGVLSENMIYCLNTYLYVLACKRLRQEMFEIIRFWRIK
ncbi:G-protein coupled receptor 183-A-like [Lineus longissimus]|uniref:G-protein coupled receptor 183-A-like n=1 Tax=Lineus longissimus TaxID=88925 RepID=UPI00315C9E42